MSVAPRLHILIVEDDETLRKVMRILFFDHELVETTTLAEARAAQAGREFDVVIADFTLPDGNGGTLLRELHAAGDPAHRILHSATPPLELADLVDTGVVMRYFRKPSWRELALHLAQLRPRRPSADVRIMTVEKRSEPRTAIELGAYVRCESWQAVRRLYTQDLSQGGLSLRAREPAPEQAPVRIALTLPDGLKLRLKGEVRYSTALSDPDGAVSWKIGVRLHDPGERARLVLRSLIRASADSGVAGGEHHESERL